MRIGWRSQTMFWLLLLLAGFPAVASAHVKWFSNFSFADRPLTIPQVVNPTVIALLALSFVALAVLVLIDRTLEKQSWYRAFNDWFEERKQHSTLVMRIGLGATLLMAWQADAMLVPKLPVEMAWIGWFQFALVFFLLFERTVPVAAIGTALLYGFAVVQFGWFYMLDYLIFAGAAYYLLVSNHENSTVRETGIPVLYFSVGFSLIWVALEKIFYPQWGLYILQQNPQLSLGLPIDFFLIGAAFVELALGYLLIICLLERPLSLLITLVFFTTTLVFGKVEVIGHTIVHAALVVFLLQGPGDVYKAPITFHKRTPMRMAFASVNFVLLVALLSLPYAWGAARQYAHAAAEAHASADETTPFVSEETQPPSVRFEVVNDPMTGWQLILETDHFKFVPENSTPEMGQGYAFVFADDQLIGITKDNVYPLRGLEAGEHTITVSLHAVDGSLYTVDGEGVTYSSTVAIEPRGPLNALINIMSGTPGGA